MFSVQNMRNCKSEIVILVLVAIYWQYIFLSTLRVYGYLSFLSSAFCKSIAELYEKPNGLSNVATRMSLQVIPERAKMTYINEKYIYNNASINVRRYGRKSAYYINIEGSTKVTFGDNVSLNCIFFEFLHNEYKRSFVEMKFPKICDTIEHDPYVGRAFKQIGLICPLAPSTYKLMNLSIPMDDFPNVWPFERCKVEATLLQNQKNKDIIASVDLYLSFKQKPLKH